MALLRKAVFLDRDGVINRNVFYPDTGEYESPRTAADFQLFPWTMHALRRLSEAGFSLFVVSNQPNYAKGKSSLDELISMRDQLVADAADAGITLIDSFYCFHHPTSQIPGYGPCECRKPSPKFLLDAAAKYGVDLAISWMLGDRATDIECGLRAGVRTVLIASDHPNNLQTGAMPDLHAANLMDAAELICTSAASPGAQA